MVGPRYSSSSRKRVIALHLAKPADVQHAQRRVQVALANPGSGRAGRPDERRRDVRRRREPGSFVNGRFPQRSASGGVSGERVDDPDERFPGSGRGER